MAPSRASEHTPLPVPAPGAGPQHPRSPGNGWKGADMNIDIITGNKKANSSRAGPRGSQPTMCSRGADREQEASPPS